MYCQHKQHQRKYIEMLIPQNFSRHLQNNRREEDMTKNDIILSESGGRVTSAYVR